MKILAPPLLAAASLAIVAWSGSSALQEQRSALSEEFAVYSGQIASATALPRQLSQIQLDLYKLSVWSIAGVRDSELNAARADIRGLVASAKSALTVFDAVSEYDSTRVQSIMQEYEAAVSQALILIERSPIVGATATRGIEIIFKELVGEVLVASNAAEAAFKKNAEAASARAEAAAERFTTMSALVSALVSAMALVVAFGVGGTIRRVSSALDRLTRGDTDVDVRLAERSDEIGAVGRAIVQFAEALEARRELEEGLRAQREEALELAARAEAANQAKASFLATMSHEIRTPLNGVLGMLAIMLSGRMEDEQRQRAEIASTSARQLLRLLNDILDLSKLEAGRIELERLSLSPSQIACDVVSLLSARADEKGVELVFEVTPETPSWVEGDPMRLRQVLVNLCGNAVKFTDRGSVVIAASWTGDAEAGLLRIEVRDTGIGIAASVLPKLFQRFSQADGSTTRRFGGTGLGLAISRQLMELMGGEIGVDSVEGEGSIFWITLPTRATRAPAISPSEFARAPIRARSDKSLRILAVEDNTVNQQVIRQMLEVAGFSAQVAGDGEEAIAAVKAEAFDVILMDVQMPVMDGVSATRAIRAMANDAAKTPIIALTANAMSGDRERYLAAGMDDYVSKPIDPDALFAAIASAASGVPRDARDCGDEGAAAAPDQQEVENSHAVLAQEGEADPLADLLDEHGATRFEKESR